ncbi:MAG: hypothetical protein AB7K09_10220 [Planctomycetota bacterium]
MSLVATGEREEFPESPIVGATLPGGWYIVVWDHFGKLENEAYARKLSAKGTAVLGQVEEHVMWSAAVGFADGKQEWRVVHDGQQGVAHLSVTATLRPPWRQSAIG